MNEKSNTIIQVLDESWQEDESLKSVFIYFAEVGNYRPVETNFTKISEDTGWSVDAIKANLTQLVHQGALVVNRISKQRMVVTMTRQFRIIEGDAHDE